MFLLYKRFFFFLILSCPLGLMGSSYIEFSPKARQAYDAAIALKIEEAKRHLEELQLREPDNITAEYIANTIDVYTILVNDVKSEYEQLHRQKNRRLTKIESVAVNSPYKLFLQAEIRLQWAFAKFQFGEEFSSFKEASKAFKLLERNQKAYPNFIGNKKSLGLLHILIGSVPDSYKWGVEWFSGMKGDVKEGINEIESVLEYARYNNFIFEEEALIQYGMVMLQMGNQNDELWQTLKHRLNPKKSRVSCSILSYIGIKTGHNEEALKILENRPKGAAYKSFPYFDFLIGMAKLQRLDRDADVYFKKFINNTKGRNYIKAAYRNIGLSYLLRGDVKNYKVNLAKCEKYGSSIIWIDKKALQEAKSKEIPDFTLLKARMLFDGGYYNKALALLQQFDEDNFLDAKDRLEYTYRLGRVFHGLENYMEAVRYYQETINKGSKAPYYFACRSALEAGLVFEKLKNKNRAKGYFNKCLKISPKEYKASLHQKAKAGLGRLK